MPQLSDFSNARLQHAEIAALARLHLFFTARTHELIGGFANEASARIIVAGGADGTLDLAKANSLQFQLAGLWGDTLNDWVKDFQKSRVIAATLPFGMLAEMHQRLVFDALPMTEVVDISGKTMLEEARVNQGVFDPQIQVLVDAASEFLYGDGLNLSGRIWQMDREARNMMNQLILNAVQNGDSAWNLAQQLEVYLGASADCPRWTSTRLYKLTKKDIAGGDLRGLVSGDACDGKGVSYNALRLARTEIQRVHALATDKVMLNSPWVEQEQVNLSAGHPEPDECNDVIDQGEGGKGIYPVGTISLPIHPNCLCYKTSILMDETQFINDLAAWTKGEQDWTAMDSYAQFIGANNGDVTQINLSKDSALLALAVWLFSQDLKL